LKCENCADKTEQGAFAVHDGSEYRPEREKPEHKHGKGCGSRIAAHQRIRIFSETR